MKEEAAQWCGCLMMCGWLQHIKIGVMKAWEGRKAFDE
jgi:hypothetical protein